jgi:hypothetical protein
VFVSGVAVGVRGALTVGVMVVFATWPSVSETWYLTAVAVPLNVGNGSKVTVPFAFTVYVPWLATVNVVCEQLLGD